MTSVLRLVAIGHTLSFLNASGAYLTNKGFRQAIAHPDELGVYPDIEDVILLDWMQTDDDARDTTMRTLQKLGAQARENVRKRKLGNHVWLECSTHSETSTRYAIVKDIIVPDLDERHWGPGGPSRLAVHIIREGLWRHIAPNSTSYTSLATGTIYPYTDATNENYLDVNATDNILGDAPSLNIIELDGSVDNNARLIIATKSGTAASLNNFNPFFNANDELDNAASQQADTNAPDDINLTLTGSGDVTLRWNITGANLTYYSGSYLVYVVGVASADGAMSVAFQHGAPTVGYYETGDYVPVNTAFGSNNHFLYLGRFTLPLPGAIIPGYAYTANYSIELEVDKSSSVTFTFYSLILIPVDEQVFRVLAQGAPNKLRIDSNLERTFYLGASDQLLAEPPPTTLGRYIQLQPILDPLADVYHRVFFFKSWYYDTDDEEYYQFRIDDSAVTIEAICRYTALRGDDA